MFRGFNLSYEKKDYGYMESARKMYSDQKKAIYRSLNDYLERDGSLDGTKMREDWFPEIECDVFISHSHIDEDKALSFAGKLFEEFDIRSFIDSSLWGFSNDLLKKIDDKYCLNKRTGHYRYEDRNFSTSHVHLMLASALTIMIDKSECVFFFNSDNSLTFENIKTKTYSPWIYHELLTCKYIKKYEPAREPLQESMIKKSGIRIGHEVDLHEFVELSYNDISSWVRNCKNKYKGWKALEYLYEKHPEI